jgi:hypothetical protein
VRGIIVFESYNFHSCRTDPDLELSHNSDLISTPAAAVI